MTGRLTAERLAVIRDALDYLFHHAELYEIRGGLERATIETVGQRSDAVEALAALQAELDEAKVSIRTIIRENGTVVSRQRREITAARADNTRLRDALEFYAAQYGIGAMLASDGGGKARAALAVSSPASGPADHDEAKHALRPALAAFEEGKP